jgi:hypothetical protein
MKKITLLLVMLLFTCMITNGQSGGASVLFADGKRYYGKVLSYASASSIDIKFLHSDSRYTFNKQGVIVSSTGAYPKGQKVKLISVKDGGNSVYTKANVGKPNDILGIKFSDYQSYFCSITKSENEAFTCIFYHSSSVYTIKKEGNVWKVFSSGTGAYPAGHALLDIWTLEDGWIFYTDGGNYDSVSPGPQKWHP